MNKDQSHLSILVQIPESARHMTNHPHDPNIYSHFIECFQEATQHIQPSYMLLPVAGSVLPVYRERVYCYELYHQLRIFWGEFEGYSLGGEVDKTHHPIMNGLDIANTKPDLLVHRPGDMGGNLIIIEVKPITADKLGIRKDLRTLTAFKHRGQYQHAIYLVYGNNSRGISSFLKLASILQEEDEEDRIDLNSIELFWHRFPENPAELIKW